MGKEILTLGDIEIEKKNFYGNKIPILFKYVDTEKVSASDKISFGEKNYKDFIGYFYNDDKVKPLKIMLPKISAYVKSNEGQTNGCVFY